MSRSKKSDRGANLVEFALIMPLLLILLLGIVEFGFVLGQFNEIRHGAHEGARLAAVDDASLGDSTCDAMDLTGDPTVDFTDSTNGEIGEMGTVTISVNVTSLTGINFMEALLPSQLSTSAEFRLEQPSTNWDSANQDHSPSGTSCP